METDTGADLLELASKLPGSQHALLAAYQQLVNRRQVARTRCCVAAHMHISTIPLHLPSAPASTQASCTSAATSQQRILQHHR
jgi:hypothetical protein